MKICYQMLSNIKRFRILQVHTVIDYQNASTCNWLIESSLEKVLKLESQHKKQKRACLADAYIKSPATFNILKTVTTSIPAEKSIAINHEPIISHQNNVCVAVNWPSPPSQWLCW